MKYFDFPFWGQYLTVDITFYNDKHIYIYMHTFVEVEENQKEQGESVDNDIEV